MDKDNINSNEFYILALSNHYGLKYLESLTHYTAKTTQYPEKAMRFDTDLLAKTFFFDNFRDFQKLFWGDSLLTDVSVDKVVPAYNVYCFNIEKQKYVLYHHCKSNDNNSTNEVSTKTKPTEDDPDSVRFSLIRD